MSNKLGTFTITSTGIKSITGFGFNPNDLEFTCLAKNGSASQLSVMVGSVDSAGNQFVKADYYGSTGYSSTSWTDAVIFVREHSGGTWVNILTAYFVDYVADGFRINVTQYNGGSAYPIAVKARTT